MRGEPDRLCPFTADDDPRGPTRAAFVWAQSAGGILLCRVENTVYDFAYSLFLAIRTAIVMDRKLAAILAADVVGYSALMEADEAGTHERLKAGRKELFEPEIARHHGRVFKVMGDGMLAEFGSVVDAVECAVALQRGLAERNAAVPEEQRIQVRIGINLGEVIVEGDDRYGEGVNIATRLEQLAEPGGIYVSGKVAKEVEKRLAFGFEPMGEQKVKNLAEPVSVFRIKLDDTPARGLARLPSRRVWPWAAAIAAALLVIAGAWFAWRPPAPETAVVAPDPVVADARPSLVVLPFANLSDDKEQGYLADGITEDLTTELARVPGLFVISRNAAFTYKGKAVAPAQIAKDLGVRYILEGSTRRAGEAMRINAQLIDTRTGGHVWAERFDGRWAEVFALQDKVVANVAGTLKLKLVPSSAEEAGGTNNAAAYDAWLRGWDLRKRDSVEDFVKAADYFKQALALDPQFGAADAALAYIYWDANEPRQKALGISWEENNAKLLEHLDAAAKHPSTDYYGMLAQLLVRQQKSDEAIAALQKAIALNPSESWIYEDMSQALTFNGRAADGLAFLDSAMRVDPGWTPRRYYLQGLAYFSQDRFADAVTSLEKIDFQSGDFWSKYYALQVLLPAYGHLDRDAEIAAVKEKFQPVLNELFEGQEISGLLTQNFFAFKNYADFERLLDGLRKAGVPEARFGMDTASMDRLTGAEIGAIFYGHELEGRELDTDESYWQSTAPDGTARLSLGASSDTGVFRIEGDTYCVYWRMTHRHCTMVFRNPTGTLEKRNEYLQIIRYRRIEFSVVK
jgi:adenylate cyclase